MSYFDSLQEKWKNAEAQLIFGDAISERVSVTISDDKRSLIVDIPAFGVTGQFEHIKTILNANDLRLLTPPPVESDLPMERFEIVLNTKTRMTSTISLSAFTFVSVIVAILAILSIQGTLIPSLMAALVMAGLLSIIAYEYDKRLERFHTDEENNLRLSYVSVHWGFFYLS